MPAEPWRVALIGYGRIGRELHEALSRESSLEVVGVHTRSGVRLAGIPPVQRIEDLAGLRSARPALVVEAAHPDVTRRWGATILEFADYLPVSLTALADAALFAQLAASARLHDHRLLVPHGAVVGGDSLFESREHWDDVEIEFRKHPRNVAFGDAGTAEAIREVTMLFEGSVREIAARYPLNVNAMVACALMSVGLDRCRARLIADPSTELAHLRIIARGRDGAVLDLRRDQPVAGVSGTEMARSLLGSVLRACPSGRTVDFV